MNTLNIKTVPEAVDYLNKIILGMSTTNGLVPKAYNSIYAIQERLRSLEVNGVTLANESDLQAQIDQIVESVQDLSEYADTIYQETQNLWDYVTDNLADSGWIQLPRPTGTQFSEHDMFIRRIGDTVNIVGYFECGTSIPTVITTVPVDMRPEVADVAVTFINYYGEPMIPAALYTYNGILQAPIGGFATGELYYTNVVYTIG